jgi:hypothetical protein
MITCWHGYETTTEGGRAFPHKVRMDSYHTQQILNE